MPRYDLNINCTRCLLLQNVGAADSEKSES